ncbi:hypothetical protein U9M48_005463 [Paspalum notatum var. saurae]|uniref:NAC domain-containing protein n=1 Tax=Paspalum notatum var. saurae TaxID=547442 RepID=A0AAQ3PLZ1_PASNO
MTTPRVPDLPAGIRFHPTDEELVVHYLTNQAAGAPCPVPIVAEVNIYACNPWELPARALFGDTEWYFFSPRDRKYPNGARPNRAAGDGYWKATGTDRPVLSSTTNQRVGVKKALVFYSGRSPRGVKTDWIMHEYRLVGTGGANHHHKAAAGTSKRSSSSSRGSSSSMRLDDWVLCRIYKKTNDFSSLHLISDQLEQEASSTVEEEDSSSALATNNINTAATLASPSSLKSEAHDHDHHQFLQTRTPTTMSKSCSLTDLLNTIDGSALSQMLLLDGGGGPEEVDAHAEPLIYYPPQGTTAHTHQQSLINNNNNNNNNNNVMNGGGGGGSSSHFISTNNLLPTRAVDACSDNNGLMMKRKRTMTAMDDGAAGSSLDSDDDGISKKLMKLLPSDSRNPVVGSSAAGSYCNQLLVDTNNAAAGFQFQFQPSSSPMMMRSYPFLQMQ